MLVCVACTYFFVVYGLCVQCKVFTTVYIVVICSICSTSGVQTAFVIRVLSVHCLPHTCILTTPQLTQL